jgi:transglutaminase-like putative cysteine protease
MPILTIRHLTRYRYRQPVAFGEHRMMLRPREGLDQRVIDARLEIRPHPVLIRTMQDLFGNVVTCVRFDQTSRDLTFDSHIRLDHRPEGGAAEADEPFPAAGAPFLYDAEDYPDLARAIAPAYRDPGNEVEAWTRRFAPANGRGRVGEALIAMTRAINEDFSYEQRLFDAARAPVETLARRSGSCRDFAVLMIDGARRLGLAARFVSGYLCAAPGRVGGGHTHAWAQVYLPSQGWLDFDPTNGIVDGQGLVRVAVAVDPRHALPLHGVWYGKAGDYIGLEVDVEIAPEVEPERASGVRVALAG